MAIPFVVLVVAVVLIGMSLTTRTWADAMARANAGANRGGLLGILTLPARLIERAVVPAVNYMEHVLTKAASHYTAPLARWLDHLGDHARAAVVATGLLAEATARAFEHETHVVIPRAIGRATRPLDRRTKTAIGLALGTAAALARYRRGIDRLLREHVQPELRRLDRIATHTLPRELGRIRARERALERKVERPGVGTLRRLASRLWALGLAGLFIRTLARRFPWLFCRKVKTVGGRLCGVDQNLLNALLFETLVLSGVINLEQLARQCQGIARLGEEAIRELIDELP